MKQSGQLLHLIFTYYREDASALVELLPLRRCQLSRRWGTLRIVCPDQQTVLALSEIQGLLSKPLSLLKLTRRVRLLYQNAVLHEFSVMPELENFWEREFKDLHSDI